MSTNTTQSYVAYYRVSTEQQGATGLGMQAQKAAVKAAGIVPTFEFIEVESGRKNERTQLAAAVAKAKATNSVLLVAKLDRLARNVAFLFAIQEAGVQIQALDIPNLNTLTLGIYATIAQHEAETISARTKAALAAKKAQGFKLGTPKNLTAAAIAKSQAVRTANALSNPNTTQAKGYATMLRASGATLQSIADTLNTQGFKTSRGGQYSAVQVQRLFAA